MEGFSERLWYALARLTTSLHIGPVLTNLTFKRQPGYARTHVHSNCKSSWSWYSPIEFRGENAFSEAPVWLVSCVSVPLHHAPADYAHKRFPALRNKRSDNGEKMRGALTPTYVVTENVKFYALVLDASESWGSIGVLDESWRSIKLVMSLYMIHIGPDTNLPCLPIFPSSQPSAACSRLGMHKCHPTQRHRLRAHLHTRNPMCRQEHHCRATMMSHFDLKFTTAHP
jgi:hypothetical protein